MLRFGYTGLQLLSQIVIADVTTLRWRGLSRFVLSQLCQNATLDTDWRVDRTALFSPFLSSSTTLSPPRSQRVSSRIGDTATVFSPVPSRSV